jgi:hypothetical protein
MSQCQFPLCTRHAQSNGYCISHRMYAEGEPRKKEKVTVVREVKKITEKQQKQLSELQQLKKIYLSKPENKYCAIQIDENCTRLATTVNHTRRRGKNELLDTKTWEPSCEHCNIEIENKDALAREQGHLKSKFNKN